MERYRLVMRYFLFSDVHSNIDQLERFFHATVECLDPEDRYVCLGDLVHNGGQYDDVRCIEMARQYKAQLVKGNHDIAVAALIEDDPIIAKLFANTEDVKYLTEAPKTMTEDRHIFAHTLTGRRLKAAEDSEAEFREMDEINPQAAALFLGHSHNRFKSFRKDGGVIRKIEADRINVFDGAKHIVSAGTLGEYGSEHSYLIFDAGTGIVERFRL